MIGVSIRAAEMLTIVNASALCTSQGQRQPPAGRRMDRRRLKMASRSLAPTSRSRRTPVLPSLMDPFRLMDSLLSDVVGTRAGNGGDLLAQPRINIEDKGNEIRVTAELPGVSESDVEVTLDDDMLIIAGEKRQEEEIDEGGMRLVERAFGRFRRAIQLPFAPDPNEVNAQFRDGVLTITVPKNAEQRKKERRIDVKRDSNGAGSGTRSGTSETATASSGSSSAERRSDQSEDQQRAGARRETADTAA
jgi:HSP20 family protein